MLSYREVRPAAKQIHVHLFACVGPAAGAVVW